ncbi:MAG: hypothetical protein LC101_06990 [Flavobacteriales bacterium]|nr:hypothetical protein [Flavobacteriales bacterium]
MKRKKHNACSALNHWYKYNINSVEISASAVKQHDTTGLGMMTVKGLDRSEW